MINENLASLIKSEPKTNAAKEAKKLGLRYMGFGRYAGKNGKVAYLVNPKLDKLVPYKGPDDVDKLRDNYLKVNDDFQDSRMGIGDTKDPKNKERIQKQLEKEKQKVLAAKNNFEVVHGTHKANERATNSQLFFKEKEIQRYHRALSQIYRPAIFSDAEKEAIGYYSLSGAVDLNTYLYNGPDKDTMDISLKHKMISNLDSAFDETETPIPIVVYTGLSSRYKPQNLVKGVPFVFHGYVSTSLSWKIAFNFADDRSTKLILQIDVPQNSKGIYLGEDLSASYGEYEFLLPRGSMIEVLSGPHPIEPNILSDDAFNEGDETAVLFHCRLVQTEGE